MLRVVCLRDVFWGPFGFLFLFFVNGVATVINHSSFMLYTDDTKIFKQVSSVENCVALQSDVDASSN